MTPVPLDLPLRPSEALELANLIFDQAELKPLTDDVRNRIAARGSALRLETIKAYFGSLERDPVHPSAYYLAVDGWQSEPLLLHMALATAPTSSIFAKPLLIGRLRRPNGPEMVINAIPFAASDCDAVERFCSRIDSAFLPRPHGLRPTITVATSRPDRVLPAALDEFRAVFKRTGKNLASFGFPAADASPRSFYCAGLWAAIRAGWRDGYNAAIEIALSGRAPEALKEKIRQSAALSTFAVDPAGMFLQPDSNIEEQFERCFHATDRAWIVDEFVRSFDPGDAVYELTAPEALRLAVKFGPALRAIEHLHETIRQTRSALKAGRSFDFELVLEHAAAPATPQDLIFCLHWLKLRDHAVQLVAPRLGAGPDWAVHLRTLAGIALHFQARLSIRAASDQTPEVLESIARATLGRLNYKLSLESEDLAGQVTSLAPYFVG